jgi:hypothetical protein
VSNFKQQHRLLKLGDVEVTIEIVTPEEIPNVVAHALGRCVGYEERVVLTADTSDKRFFSPCGKARHKRKKRQFLTLYFEAVSLEVERYIQARQKAGFTTTRLMRSWWQGKVVMV